MSDNLALGVYVTAAVTAVIVVVAIVGLLINRIAAHNDGAGGS
jgi:hypothetical protein